MLSEDSTEGSCDISKECSLFDNLCLNQIDIVSGQSAAESCVANTGAIIFEMVLFMYAMIGLAIVCDDYLCIALERLCDRFMIREDVAGATFMAFGSAAPEIIVNTVSTLKQIGSDDAESRSATNTGVGAILGSGMVAFLIIPGACALATDDTLFLKRRPLLRDLVAYALSLLLLCIFFEDGIIEIYEGALLVIMYVCYVMVVMFGGKIRSVYREKFLKRTRKKRKSFVKDKKTSSKKKSNSIKSPLIENLLEEGGDVRADTNESDTSSTTSSKVSFKNSDSEKDNQDTSNIRVVSTVAEGNHEDSSDNGDGDEDEDEDHNEPSTRIGKFFQFITVPLKLMFQYTCVNCEKDSVYESYYPATLVASAIWVTIFSVIIGACVQRWIVFSPNWLNGGTFGLVAIAIGAEIPDTIQSVTMARNGYGSMAVSNAFGSQIINICIGLGLPWLIATLSIGDTRKFLVTAHDQLQDAAYFQFAAITVTFILLLGPVLLYKQPKAELTYAKGTVFLTMYFLIIIGVFIVNLYNS